MADDFLSNLAAGLRVWGGVSDAYHKRDVANRVDQIMKASNGGRGDLNALDPSLVSDGVGMEAMGQITAQLSKTGQAQNQIFQNALINANNQWKMANQYMADFDEAVKNPERQGDAANLLISMGNSMGVPYRYSMGENGRIKVTHVTPEGEQDMGDMSLVDAYKMAKGYMTSQDSFVKNSVMHNMAMSDINAQIQMAGASKWLTGIDPKTGRQVVAMPQYNLQNGAVEYILPGGARMTADQLGKMGIQWGTAAQTARMGLRGLGGAGGGGGAGAGGGAGNPANLSLHQDTINAIKTFSTRSVTGEDGKTTHVVDPYKQEILTAFALQGKRPGSVSMIWDQNFNALVNSGVPADQASVMVYQKMLQFAQGAPAAPNAPQDGQPAPDGNETKKPSPAVEKGRAIMDGNGPRAQERRDQAGNTEAAPEPAPASAPAVVVPRGGRDGATPIPTGGGLDPRGMFRKQGVSADDIYGGRSMIRR